ncbi:hypothetical protein [Bradyrhizobium sp. 6(2017)]|uniref:hypothetical protein n=1 Tax=Bradyrhizobium sp. 6(2017) TaxID=1197460 RepID=UPI0013E1BD35|nr:hypothetical protein [Bradyrhizobium sp. 6(2017)]QIG94423.1 hypothetical protein G6P99_19375 [Bradyrhizobium sp. 6(2017)]
MVKRPAKFGERLFATLCSDGGAKASKTEEDENGWDYFVELPNAPHSGPLDTQPAEQAAFVQVKSKTTRGLSVSVKLSNALKAAASPLPFFIVMVVISKATKPKLYAKHVWAEMMTIALREGRLADRNGTLPNKKRIGVQFTSNDEITGDIVEWMLTQISMIGGDYQSNKTKLFREIGHDEAWPGSMTLQGTKAQIYRNFLGLGNGLPISDFTCSPLRFGMSSPKTDIKVTSGTVHIEPKPIGSCEIRLQGSADTPTIVAPAKLYSYNPTGKAGDESFRVSAGQIEVLFGPKDISSGLEFRADPTELLDVKSLRDVIVFNYWQSVSAKILIEVFHESGMRLFRSTVDVVPKNKGDWETVLEIVKTLEAIVGSSNFRISLAELKNKLNDLNFLYQMTAAPDMHYELRPEDKLPSIDFVAYFCEVQLGGYHVASLMQRAATGQQTKDDLRIFDFGAAINFGNYVFQNGMGDTKRIIRDIYQEAVERLGETTQVLNVGDMRAFADQQARV